MPLYISREGSYCGQCSELCGVLHGFMPIIVEGVSYEEYLEFLEAASLENEVPAETPPAKGGTESKGILARILNFFGLP